jgi:hypothetical protein
VSTKESERELENEGKRCGVLRGWSLPFIGARGALGGGLKKGFKWEIKTGE